MKENASYREKTTARAIFYDVLTIIVLASAFGLMGFLYSLIDFTQPPHKVVALEPFRAITVQEIGGHFLFGFVAAGATAVIKRNLKVAILVGLMALTIDADHVLNVAKLPVQARLDHSVFFAILSVPAMGLLAIQIIQRNSSLVLLLPNKRERTNDNRNNKDPTSNNNYNENDDNKDNNAAIVATSNQDPKERAALAKYIFIQFSVITIAAVLSHIAYDVFVDDYARFPLLNPLNFSQILIPRISAIPIEVAAFLIIYFFTTRIRVRHS